MRSTLAFTATILALAWAAPPASAQMCGGSPSTTGATASAPASGGCPMMRSAAMGSGQSADGQRRPMCPMMAMMRGMMRGGSSGGMGGMQMRRRSLQPPQPRRRTPEWASRLRHARSNDRAKPMRECMGFTGT